MWDARLAHATISLDQSAACPIDCSATTVSGARGCSHIIGPIGDVVVGVLSSTARSPRMGSPHNRHRAGRVRPIMPCARPQMPLPCLGAANTPPTPARRGMAPPRRSCRPHHSRCPRNSQTNSPYSHWSARPSCRRIEPWTTAADLRGPPSRTCRADGTRTARHGRTEGTRMDRIRDHHTRKGGGARYRALALSAGLGLALATASLGGGPRPAHADACCAGRLVHPFTHKGTRQGCPR